MSAAQGAIGPISSGRRRTDRVAHFLLAAGAVIALVPLILVLYYLIKKGAGALSGTFFTSDPTGAFIGDPGGVKSAILGTIELVGLATLIAVPIGVGVALYLTEYGREKPFARAVRYFVDVMTGVPSIVFGLFIYITLVLTGVSGVGFAGWKGSIALALLMLPVVTRAAEVVLLLVPDSLREAGLALGSPRWRLLFRVVIPAALPGIITGTLLAVARAAGETAPLLFTSTIVNATNFNLNERTNSLPVQIFNDITQPNNRLVERAWGAALTLVLMILLLTLIARLISRRSRLT
jgi:phosphate transport system permease protein